jgi:hypothetical protein
LLGFFLGILASHFAPSTRCFYTLFPPLKLPTTRDVHSTPQQSFSPFRRECFYERSSSLSLSFQREREREREKEITPFILTHNRPFLRLARKSPQRVSRVFFNPHRLFLPQKKEKIIIEQRAKILARTKTLYARFENKSENEKVFRESAREILFVLASSPRVWKTRFINKKTF